MTFKSAFMPHAKNFVDKYKFVRQTGNGELYYVNVTDNLLESVCKPSDDFGELAGPVDGELFEVGATVVFCSGEFTSFAECLFGIDIDILDGFNIEAFGMECHSGDILDSDDYFESKFNKFIVNVSPELFLLKVTFYSKVKPEPGNSEKRIGGSLPLRLKFSRIAKVRNSRGTRRTHPPIHIPAGDIRFKVVYPGKLRKSKMRRLPGS